VIIELTEDGIFGVGIQAEPCYRGRVIHKRPFVVVNVINNLADDWRIRICSFTESLICSIHQVVRFSIYQELTPIGAFGESAMPVACRVTGSVRLSFFR
jgi:hypothetical protein